jgi:ATP-dependent DNA ligase
LINEDYPWLLEVKEALDKTQSITTCVILAETYAVREDGRPYQASEVSHALKSDTSKIRLAPFDIVSVNGKTANNSYIWRLQELDNWFKDCKLVHIPPYLQAKTLVDVEDFWNYWITSKGYEGLFARDSHQDLWKVKPAFDVDAVIIGLNRRSRWDKGEVTSIKVALIASDGNYVEIGDVASGIDQELRKVLMGLLQYKQGQDLNWGRDECWIQITPFVIVQVQATETFQAKKPVYKREGDRLKEIGFKDAHSLRHPRLIRFRKDKKATVEDIGYERQLPA